MAKLTDKLSPADPAPTATDELRQAREAVDEAKAGVAEARGLDWQATALSVLVDELEALSTAQQQRIEALEKALEPFANMGYIFVNSKTIHPSYNGQDREIYSLNDAVLTRRDFERAYEALLDDEKGA